MHNAGTVGPVPLRPVLDVRPEGITEHTVDPAGLGIALVPACMALLKRPDVVYLPVRLLVPALPDQRQVDEGPHAEVSGAGTRKLR